jgi:hypothetical protein
VTVKEPSIVCEDVVFTVIVPEPLFLTTYILPAIPTAVGNVTEKVPLQSIK